MCEPPLVHYSSEMEFREHFERIYCSGTIMTFDGIPVRFRKSDFSHCMRESLNRDGIKDTQISRIRAERIDWIIATLQNKDADLYQGWDKKKKIINPNRRVAVFYDDFVVIIECRKTADGKVTAIFKTAFVADNSIGKIRGMPRWDIKNCR